MKIKAVLFDLDGTLLPMDMDAFAKTYFGGLAKWLVPHGFEPQQFIQSIWKGVGAMVKNTGGRTNENVFWDTFKDIYGEGVRENEPYFDAYYRERFDEVQSTCGVVEKAKGIIDKIKSKGVTVALATNPLFPAIATKKRIKWAGLDENDFAIVTTYENCTHSKPNLDYYRDVLSTLNLKGEECIMVGNDVDEDMVAEMLGMKVFLITDCLLNKSGKDISVYPHGSFDELDKFLDENLQ
jgi:FMN phosphatase YigB (HAD superfamily)